MIEKYKHIIWDWNGTLLNDVQFSMDLINRLLNARGLKTLRVEEYREIFTIPVKNYYSELGFDFSKEPFEKVGREWMDGYEEGKFECKLYDGVKETLEQIQIAGIGQSILSAYSQHTLEEIVDYHGLKKYFTHIVGLDNIYAASKLHLGKDLMKKLGNGKGETLLIGDTEHDYEVAVEIGADCVLLSGGHQSKRKLEKLGCPVIPDLKSLL